MNIHDPDPPYPTDPWFGVIPEPSPMARALSTCVPYHWPQPFPAYTLPGPYKCPDCGTWWTGPEHRCQWVSGTGTPPGYPEAVTSTGTAWTAPPQWGNTC